MLLSDEVSILQVREEVHGQSWGLVWRKLHVFGYRSHC
jgi:hypothetical protein